MILFCNSQKVFPSSICIGCRQKRIPMICKKHISLIIFMVAMVSRGMTLIFFVSLRMKCYWIDLHIINNIILIRLISIKSSIVRLYRAFFDVGFPPNIPFIFYLYNTTFASSVWYAKSFVCKLYLMYSTRFLLSAYFIHQLFNKCFYNQVTYDQKTNVLLWPIEMVNFMLLACITKLLESNKHDF